MKIYTGSYPSRFISRIHQRYMEKKYNYLWSKNNNKFEAFLEKLESTLQWLYNHSINLYLDKKKRKIQIKLNKYDTWNAYQDLSLIILPLLKRLKEEKQGTPWVFDEDVPAELNIRSTDSPAKENEYDWDDNVGKRWDWVLNEIIWSFEQISDENSDDKFFTHHEEDYNLSNISNWKTPDFDKEGYEEWNARIERGLILFGKYFRSLWT